MESDLTNTFLSDGGVSGEDPQDHYIAFREKLDSIKTDVITDANLYATPFPILRKSACLKTLTTEEEAYLTELRPQFANDDTRARKKMIELLRWEAPHLAREREELFGMLGRENALAKVEELREYIQDVYRYWQQLGSPHRRQWELLLREALLMWAVLRTGPDIIPPPYEEIIRQPVKPKSKDRQKARKKQRKPTSRPAKGAGAKQSKKGKSVSNKPEVNASDESQAAHRPFGNDDARQLRGRTTFNNRPPVCPMCLTLLTLNHGDCQTYYDAECDKGHRKRATVKMSHIIPKCILTRLGSDKFIFRSAGGVPITCTADTLCFPLLCPTCEFATKDGDLSFLRFALKATNSNDEYSQNCTQVPVRQARDAAKNTQNTLFWQFLCIRALVRPYTGEHSFTLADFLAALPDLASAIASYAPKLVECTFYRQRKQTFVSRTRQSTAEQLSTKPRGRGGGANPAGRATRRRRRKKKSSLSDTFIGGNGALNESKPLASGAAEGGGNANTHVAPQPSAADSAESPEASESTEDEVMDLKVMCLARPMEHIAWGVTAGAELSSVRVCVYFGPWLVEWTARTQPQAPLVNAKPTVVANLQSVAIANPERPKVVENLQSVANIHSWTFNSEGDMCVGSAAAYENALCMPTIKMVSAVGDADVITTRIATLSASSETSL